MLFLPTAGKLKTWIIAQKLTVASEGKSVSDTSKDGENNEFFFLNKIEEKYTMGRHLWQHHKT